MLAYLKGDLVKMFRGESFSPAEMQRIAIQSVGIDRTSVEAIPPDQVSETLGTAVEHNVLSRLNLAGGTVIAGLAVASLAVSAPFVTAGLGVGSLYLLAEGLQDARRARRIAANALNLGQNHLNYLS